MTRLVNSLNGFDNDVIINISDNQQIGNVLGLLMNKYSDKEEFTKEAFKELKERGYSDKKIEEWLKDLD